MTEHNQARHLDINGQQYFLRDHGSGDEVVFLAHGMPDDSTVWRHQIPVLTAANYEHPASTQKTTVT